MMPRTDTKRIEVLRLIATVLQWDNEQREKAGLQRSYERSSAFGFFGFGRPAHKASETDNSIGDEVGRITKYTDESPYLTCLLSFFYLRLNVGKLVQTCQTLLRYQRMANPLTCAVSSTWTGRKTPSTQPHLSTNTCVTEPIVLNSPQFGWTQVDVSR